MRFLFVFILSTLASAILVAQSPRLIQGVITDATTGAAIPYAHIIVKGTEDGTISDFNGNFRLSVPTLPVLLVISEVAHETRFVRVIEDSVQIKLEAFSLELEGISVFDKGEPYFQMAAEVLDFEFYDDLILILDNSGREVRLIDHRGRIVDITQTPGKYKEIFKDCLNNLHVVAEDTAWQVYYDYENIRFIHPTPTYLFDLYLRNCQGRFNGGLIYSLSRRRGLVNSFLFAAGGTTQPFYEIGDTNALNYLDSNFDLNYFIDQRQSGNGRYNMSVTDLENSLERLQDDMVMDWFDKRIMDPGEYFVFSDDKDLRIISTAIMTEFSFQNIEGEPGKRLLKIAENHLDYLAEDETNKAIYAVYRSGMGKVWSLNIDQPNHRLDIPDYAFPGDLKVRDDYLFFVVDPSMNGSNLLLRKNEKFGESKADY